MSADSADQLVAAGRYQEAYAALKGEIAESDRGYHWESIGRACSNIGSRLQWKDPGAAAFFYGKAISAYSAFAAASLDGGEGSFRMIAVRDAEEALRNLGRANRPGPDEVGFMDGYCARVPQTGDVLKLLEKQYERFPYDLRAIPEGKQTYRYDWNKWTVAEVVNHITDTERIFSYRALRIARRDTTPLPGFEQDPYVGSSQADRREWRDLVDEWESVRSATLSLFRSLPTASWLNRGEASGKTVSVRALACGIWGHLDHHAYVLNQRYLR